MENSPESYDYTIFHTIQVRMYAYIEHINNVELLNQCIDIFDQWASLL